MANEASGSARMLANYDKACVLDAEAIQRVRDTLDRHDLRLIDWHCKGQPVPDWIGGSVQVSRDRVGKAIQALADIEGVRLCCLDGFPYGFPDPDEFRVAFEAVAGQ
ncbi:MAG: hypothetical protein AAF481_17120 [Acidobacteriota bacterium]